MTSAENGPDGLRHFGCFPSAPESSPLGFKTLLLISSWKPNQICGPIFRRFQVIQSGWSKRISKSTKLSKLTDHPGSLLRAGCGFQKRN